MEVVISVICYIVGVLAGYQLCKFVNKKPEVIEIKLTKYGVVIHTNVTNFDSNQKLVFDILNEIENHLKTEVEVDVL